MASKKILVAPLNWGLGHATRCIPIISALETLGIEPILASDGVALHLLRAEFPHLETVELPSYKIFYRQENMIFGIGRQLPRIFSAVQKERRATENLVEKYGLAGVISDNRYGCFSKKVPAVLLTHQLNLRVPNWFLEKSANWVLRRALKNFDSIWVPDVAKEGNLSGELSHGSNPAHPDIYYIGILSRMKNYVREREYDVAVVLSGPEPQRTILESRLMEQAMMLPQDFIFIQGKTNITQHYRASENVEVVSYLTSHELNDVLMSSRVVVCRSGYSSLMDLAMLGKKAILIPTPGQTEQVYLADYFSEKGIFHSQKQSNLDLEKGILNLGQTKGIPAGQFRDDEFLEVLEKWVARL